LKFFSRAKEVWSKLMKIRDQKLDRQTLIYLLITAFIVLFIILCVLLIVGGCQSKKLKEEALKPEIVNVRGYLYHGPEVSAFRKCDENQEYMVTGDIGVNVWKIYTDLVPEPYLPVYVEMKAQIVKNDDNEKRTDYVGYVVLKELYHMSYESFGCELPKNYNYLIHGNEPSWKIIIDDSRGVFMQVDGSEEIFAAYSKPSVIDNGIQYKLMSGSSPIIIKIRKADTYDSMSGAYYGYSSYVSFKGKAYYGEALPGRPLF